MPVPPTGHSYSIDSASSYGSSKSSLLAPPLDPVSSQSDIADPFMPRGDSSAYAVAASPAQSTGKDNNKSSAASASQKFKRAWGKRRHPSQDATTLLSSSDERSASDYGPAASSSSHNRPSAAKLTMHIFGGRKATQSVSNGPPPLPPKPSTMRPPATAPPALHAANISNNPFTNTKIARPRSSIMVTSPSINAAIEFMREDEERQSTINQRREYRRDTELDQQKEDWRKSDSTVASGHTLRPTRPQDPFLNTTTKRRSTYSAPSNGASDNIDIIASAPAPSTDAAIDSSAGKHARRRSLLVNINASPRQPSPSAAVPAAAPTYTSPPTSLRLTIPTIAEPISSRSPSPGPAHSHPASLTPALHDTPTLSGAAANGIISSGTASGSPISKTNIRGRLAAWTATTALRGRSPSPLAGLSSPSTTSLDQARTPTMSNASHPTPGIQAIAAVREIRDRKRSPSAASNVGATGIRQAATSLSSGAGALALGLGKRAYEKVGRVWAGSGGGSWSDTPDQYPSAIQDDARHTSHHPGHAPSAFPLHGRRTQNAPSGTWSVSSLGGGSRSSSEKDGGGRDTPPKHGPGRLVRPPRVVGGGVVFGRELWGCVRETRANLPPSHPLAGRMIPALVLRCAQHLHRWGIQEEGLFRISGRSSHINVLRHEFDSGADYDITDCSPSELDPHAVASLFKAYLRELPEPILTRALAPLFDTAMNSESSRASVVPPTTFIPKPIGGGPRSTPMMRKPPSLSTFTLPTSMSLRAPSTALIEALGDLVARLPRENRDLLLTVIDLIQATAARSQETKMPLSNLLLVFCPSLGMSPTLLRVLCDAPGVWERALQPPVVDIVKPPVVVQDEGEETDDSDSDSDLDSSAENADVDPLPAMYKTEEEGNTLGDEERPQFEVETGAATTSEDAEVLPQTENLASTSVSRPRVVRRVPVPGVLLDEQRLDQLLTYCNRSFTPTQSPTELIPDPTSPPIFPPSIHASSRSTTPLSAISRTSSPLRSHQTTLPFPTSRRVSPSLQVVSDNNKDLPPSPSSVRHPEVTNGVSSTPSLRTFTDTFPAPVSSRTKPTFPSSRSAPSVVFPSATTSTTPTTPTSPRKHPMTSSIGRQAKMSEPYNLPELPSPSKRLVRRPSLNILFNMKRSGSPQPRSRTPTISSPLSISFPLGLHSSNPSVELSPRTVTDPLPPVLTLPLDGSLDVGLGLGWDDVFGSNAIDQMATAASQPRPTATSQLPSSPASPFHRPTTEFPPGGLFKPNGPPLAVPGPIATSEAANMDASAHIHVIPRDWEARGDGGVDPGSLHSQDDSSSGPDSPEVDSPVKEVFTPPPHLSFQLRRSSIEGDWAAAVLMAADKPAELLA